MIPPLENKLINKWFIYPDSLPGGKFRGYISSEEETATRGAFIIGQNVAFTDAQTPTLRPGYEPIGTEASDSTPVKRAWVFERRDGVQIEVKAYDTKLDFWIVGTSTAWLRLKGSFTAAQVFGFGNIGQSDQAVGWCFFCNGDENPFRWTGVSTSLASATGTTITKSGSDTWTTAGFASSGTRSVIINGTEYAYTGGEGTTTLTGVTPDPSAEAAGSIVMQSPVELTGTIGGGTDPSKFSIAMAHDGRLHSRREARQSVWDYSRLDNPDDYATGSTDGDGNAQEVEFGGPIVAFGKINKTALCFKGRIISALDFLQFGSRVDAPRYQTLVSADDKSSTIGATNQKSTFASPKGMVFVTPDKQLMMLTGITANSEPLYINISESIQSILDQGVHDEGAGICFDNKIYYSFKETVNSTTNDTVIVGHLDKQTVMSDGRVLPIFWETPYIGWNVNDWTIVYNTTDEKQELHWHSSLNSNTYKVIDDKVDNTNAFTHTLRTWGENFGLPQHEKKCSLAFIEIEMLENSELTATVLYDRNGYRGRAEYSLLGTDSANLTQGAAYNPFGASAFGSQKIGSNPQQNEMKRYVFFLELDNKTSFTNIYLQLSGDGENNDHNLIRFGWFLTEAYPSPRRALKKNTN